MPQLREISGVGPVLFERSRRAKRVSITIAPVEGVRVAVPYNISFSEAEEFVAQKRSWIARGLSKFKEIEEKRGPRLLPFEVVEKAFAKSLLTKRLAELATDHGFSYNRVTVRNQRSMWGSCSARNNISLNMKLTRLTPELIDYVILHELLHTRVKNHQKVFWSELNTQTGGRAKALDKQLKDHHLELL